MLNLIRSVTLSSSGRDKGGFIIHLGATLAVAAVTPRVRTIVICDDVSPSLTEIGVLLWKAFACTWKPPPFHTVPL